MKQKRMSEVCPRRTANKTKRWLLIRVAGKDEGHYSLVGPLHLPSPIFSRSGLGLR